MKMVKIRADVFDCRGDGNPFVRIAAGSLHDEGDAEAQRQLALGNADVVDVVAEQAPAEAAAPAAAPAPAEAQSEAAAPAPAEPAAETATAGKKSKSAA